MAGKQALILTNGQIRKFLNRVAQSRYPERDRVIFLLSVKAALRAGEIAQLTWPMVLTADGKISDRIALHNRIAKKGSGRIIPMHPLLRAALIKLRERGQPGGFVVCSERGEGMRPSSVVNWFRSLYGELGFQGCSSHSGRRTFITRAARAVFKAGGSLRDVQQLAGHRDLAHTQAYIEGDALAQRRLVAML
jgi:integrase